MRDFDDLAMTSTTEAMLPLLNQVALARRAAVLLASNDISAARVEEYLAELEAEIAKLSPR